ncbi:hypothetical protein AX774_g1684 [Zancudomyces culisetae]|uniref:Uncharacterized protein n=1 Tax=Zancudomyces culisetae TaxID=1213189 RepID=A0A1R1PV02_ZANCU|nr:hypothetical protein AX774_g1684 [Zancudomyces culisetae]|eukprot:OMH84777.1 hypothetical protein AX774_g1684 [Zancudomyces culisetae]
MLEKSIARTTKLQTKITNAIFYYKLKFPILVVVTVSGGIRLSFRGYHSLCILALITMLSSFVILFMLTLFVTVKCYHLEEYRKYIVVAQATDIMLASATNQLQNNNSAQVQIQINDGDQEQIEMETIGKDIKESQSFDEASRLSTETIHETSTSSLIPTQPAETQAHQTSAEMIERFETEVEKAEILTKKLSVIKVYYFFSI